MFHQNYFFIGLTLWGLPHFVNNLIFFEKQDQNISETVISLHIWDTQNIAY